MKELKKKNVNAYLDNPACLSLSRYYDQYDCVETIDIVCQNHIYYIQSIVNVLGKQTRCTLQLDEQGELLVHECLCQWHQDDSPCAHIGATLLKLNQLDTKILPFHYDNPIYLYLRQEKDKREREHRLRKLLMITQDSHELIEQQKQIYQINMLSITQVEKYQLIPEITFTTKQYPLLEYKVGFHKNYIIKDIHRFLQAIKKNQYIEYSKHLGFVHNREAFDCFSQQQIHFLQKIDENHDILGRNIPLKGDILDCFFNLYYGYSDMTFKLRKKQHQVELYLEEKDDIYILSILENNNYQYGQKHLYHIFQKENCCVIEQIEGDNQGILVNLIIKLTTGSLHIMKEEFSVFLKYILSPIQDYLNVKANFDVQCYFIEHIHIYGSIDHDMIAFTINYLYQDGHIQEGFTHKPIIHQKHDYLEYYFKKHASHIDYEKHIAYFRKESKEAYLFIKDGLFFLKNYGELHLTDDCKNLLNEEKKA